MVNVWFVSQNW